MRTGERQLSSICALVDLVIGMAESSCSHADEELSWTRNRDRDITVNLVVVVVLGDDQLEFRLVDLSTRLSALGVTTYLHEPQRLHGRWYLFLDHGFCVISVNLSELVKELNGLQEPS